MCYRGNAAKMIAYDVNGCIEIGENTVSGPLQFAEPRLKKPFPCIVVANGGKPNQHSDENAMMQNQEAVLLFARQLS